MFCIMKRFNSLLNFCRTNCQKLRNLENKQKDKFKKVYKKLIVLIYLPSYIFRSSFQSRPCEILNFFRIGP
jgi:hypothetical protein